MHHSPTPSMESRQAKWAFMAWLVLSSLITTANSTSFQDCYFTCFVICAITPGVAFSDCPLRCLRACIIPSYLLHNTTTTTTNLHRQHHNHFFCKLGCAASSCAKLSTKQNPAAKKVGSCVDSCSQTCSMD